MTRRVLLLCVVVCAWAACALASGSVVGASGSLEPLAARRELVKNHRVQDAALPAGFARRKKTTPAPAPAAPPAPATKPAGAAAGSAPTSRSKFALKTTKSAQAKAGVRDPATSHSGFTILKIPKPTEAQWSQYWASFKKTFNRSYKSKAIEASAFSTFKVRQQQAIGLRVRQFHVRQAEAKRLGKPAPTPPDTFLPVTFSPLSDVSPTVFKRQYLGGAPPHSGAHKKPAGGFNIKKTATSLARPSAPKSKRKRPMRFKALRAQDPVWTPTAGLPSTGSVAAPLGGDQIPKKRIGGDNLDKKLGGGDQLPKKRIGGDNVDSALSGGDQIPKKRIGGTDGSYSSNPYVPSSSTHNPASPSSNGAPSNNQAYPASPNAAPTGNTHRDLTWTVFKPEPIKNAMMMYDTRGTHFPYASRNQGECQSCWAVVATEHYQAALAVSMWFTARTNQNVFLSAQEVIDCYRTESDRGCSGGTVVGAFEFFQTKGAHTAPGYPFGLDGQQHECASDRVSRDFTIGMRYNAPPSLFLTEPCLTDTCPPNPMAEPTLLSFWKNSPYTNAGTGAKTIMPVVAYVDASNWAGYTGGIYPASDCSSAGSALSHIVQIVGYGIDQEMGMPFWLVRNTWGREWGEDGHIRLPFGSNACGLFNYVIYLDAKALIPEKMQRDRDMQAIMNNSPQVKKLQEMQDMMNNSPQVKKLQSMQEMMNNSPRMQKLNDLQSMINNSPRVKAQADLAAIINGQRNSAQ